MVGCGGDRRKMVGWCGGGWSVTEDDVIVVISK